MRIRIILIGRTERGHVAEGVKHYLERLRRMVQVEEVGLPEAGRGDPAWQCRTEADRILGALRSNERVVVLDERGTMFASPAFAAAKSSTSGSKKGD